MEVILLLLNDNKLWINDTKAATKSHFGMGILL